MILFLLLIPQVLSVRISLSYVILKSGSKIPIELSFNQTQTLLPEFDNGYINLYDTRLQIQAEVDAQLKKAIIGLKQPSSFLAALRAEYKTQEIQFIKETYLQVQIGYDRNLVENVDKFRPGSYSLNALYNFSPTPDVLFQMNLELMDGPEVIFNKIMLEQILSWIPNKSYLSYMFYEGEVIFDGQTQNIPQLILSEGDNSFRIYFQNLKYFETQDATEPSRIGIHALRDFKSFRVSRYSQDQQFVQFVRTSSNFQLYILLGGYFLFNILVLLYNKVEMEQSFNFVRQIFRWILFDNRQSRVNVLRAEVE